MRARDEVVDAREEGVDDGDRLRSVAAAFLLQQALGIEQVPIGLSELSQTALVRIARRAHHPIPPRLHNVEGAVHADALWLVPERVDVGRARGLSRERNQRERRNDICGDQATLHDTTYREHCGLEAIMRQQ